MTDDFHLFGDPSDGNEPIDPDIALVTAYLARELSPMQVIALEERLATDAEFRAQMQPLIDAWGAPIPSLDTGLARRTAPLSVLERAESWRRFQSEAIPAAPTEPIALDVPSARTTRRFSMKRVALLAAAVALPMVSFAQVVVYSANHADVPGHVIARRLVSAFAHTRGAPVRPDSSDQGPSRTASDLTDGRIPRPLSATKMAVAESAKPVEPARTAPTVAAAVARKSSVPNRALVAELTRQHHPELIRGDTSVEYVVMVLDASDGYLWSTIGNGNLGIEVAGDTRTARERAAFTFEYRDEFWGDPSTRPEARGRGMNGGFGMGAAGRGRAGGSGRSDTLVIADVSGRGRGFGGRGSALPDSLPAARLARGAFTASRIVSGDTIYTLRYDSMYVYWYGGTAARRGAAGFDSLGRGFGGARGRGAITSQPWESASGGYRAGWVGNAAGATVNRASGLEVPSAERSGVQGLGSSFVESADMYFFAPRELTSSNLRVMVVHLTPNATWRGPS